LFSPGADGTKRAEFAPSGGRWMGILPDWQIKRDIKIEPFAEARARIRDAGYEVIGVRRLPRIAAAKTL